MSDLSKSTAYAWALTGLFAAIHFDLALMPAVPTIGVEGSISLGLVSAPLTGFLLGPMYGTVAVLIASFIATAANPAIAAAGPLTPVATATGALSAGLLRTGRVRETTLLYVATLCLYLISPVGMLLPAFIWFDTIGLGVLLVVQVPPVRQRTVEVLSFEGHHRPWATVLTVWAIVFVAVLADQAMGSAIAAFHYVYIVRVPSDGLAPFYALAMFVYPVERAIASIACALVTVPIAGVVFREFHEFREFASGTSGSQGGTPQDAIEQAAETAAEE